MTLWSRIGLAGLLLLVPFAAIQAQDTAAPDSADQVGVSAVVRGQVQLSRGTEVVGRQVVSGEPLFLRDDISSGPQGGLQVLLLDETVFTLGPDSELTVDEFVYDPGTDTGKIAASITKGVFRFITGKIAQNKPEDMSIRIPVGTIGIRGTIVGGVVTPQQTEIILLGPGAINNASETVGRIEVSTPEGSVTITRSGFGTTLIPGQPPTPPRAVAPERVQAVTNTLAEQAPEESEADEANTDSSGSNSGTADTSGGSNTSGTSGTSGQNGSLDAESVQQVVDVSGQGLVESFEVAKDIGSVLETASTEEDEEDDTTQGLIDGVTNTVAQLNGQTGQFHFFQSGISLPGGGSYDIKLDLDFAARTIGGGNSEVSINSTTFGTGSFQLLAESFNNGTNGFAVFETQSNINFDCSTFGTGGCNGSFKGTLQNLNQTVAGQLAHEVTITDTGATVSETGTGTVSRSDGLSQ